MDWIRLRINCQARPRERATWDVFVELRICRRCAFACWRRFASYFSLQASRAFDATRENMAKHIYFIAIVLELCCLSICCESLPCSVGLDCKGFRLEDFMNLLGVCILSALGHVSWRLVARSMF